MISIGPKVNCHHLKTNPKISLHRQKRMALNLKKVRGLKERSIEIDKQRLYREGHLSEVDFKSNLVKKYNDKWKVCIDFSNVNLACPKDDFSLPKIEQLVDSTTGHELLSFMDAYSGYDQSSIHLANEENTSFVTSVPFHHPLNMLLK